MAYFQRKVPLFYTDQQSRNPNDHVTDVIGIRQISGNQHLTGSYRKIKTPQGPSEDLKTDRIQNCISRNIELALDLMAYIKII